MNKGFMFVIDALFVLSIIGFLFAGIAPAMDSPNQTNAAIVSSVQARDAAVVSMHADISEEIREENEITTGTGGTGNYSKVCFIAVADSGEQKYCRVID